MPKIILGLSLILLFSFLSLLRAEVYISAEKATKQIFPGYQEYKIESHFLGQQEFKVYAVYKDNLVMGWSVVSDEKGKIKPITFLVGIDTQGKVLDVYVVEYRELFFGSGIKRRSFLNQFHGKSSRDPIMVGRDIDAVTHATISSQAASSAVRKSLKLIEELRKSR